MSPASRILALGGHEFDRRGGNGEICDLIVELARSSRPRICLLPTASGDPEDQIHRFRRAFGERGCAPSVISLFRLGESPKDVRAELLAQDAIYAGGGSLLNLLAVWRAHGLDEVLLEAWDRGILLCGQSAGAMCWFEGGVTSSSGTPRVATGLGLLPGSACVHYSEAERRRRFLDAVAGEELPGGLGLEDGTGALFENRRLVRTVSARPEARVWRVEANGGAGAGEEGLTPTRLKAPTTAAADRRSEIVEFRQTRAVRAASRRAGRGAGRRWRGRID